ncbi:SET domain-containing protein [Phytophthora infestans]|uniref:SET domain-containing protein n=1 Tax=Phytophthora infestans TaxID=4787 RepID=A0A833X2N9_PHYIN|nr:SET domain-containing protein [Phytophthora infestans]KAF4127533.1 SET domain-containing protein [Phytophthora infestans]
MKIARELGLRVKDEGICLCMARRIRENCVVCPYIGKLRVTDPLERYTVKLKTKDKRNRNVFLAAKAVGNMGRFIIHSYIANCRNEELNGGDGPEIAIVASHTIDPGEEIKANYGPNQNFYHTFGFSQCVDKDRHDPLVKEEVHSRLRSGK